MENNEDKGNAPSEPKVTAPPAPPKAPSSSGKWIAVIIALLVVIGVLGALVVTHYTPGAGTSGPSATLSSQVGAISQNASYSTNITATGSFKNITVYYGDGTSQLVNYSGSKTVKVTHTYAQPGEFYIFADINYGSSTGYFFEPVKVTPNYPSIDYAYTALAVDPSTSSAQQINNISNIFSTGGHMRLNFLPAVGGGTYSIVSQTLTLYNQTGMVSQETIPYAYSITSQGYELPISGVTYADLQNGMYTLEVQTTTAPVNTTQTVTTSVTSTQSTPYGVPLVNSKNYPVSAGSYLAGTGSQNISYSLPVTNMTFVMGNQVTFNQDSLLNITSMANVTVATGSADFINATVGPLAVNSTGSSQDYSMIPAGYSIGITSGTTLIFNNNVTAMNAMVTNVNFTGNYTLGFVNAAVIAMSDNANYASSVTYGAGTAFTGLSGATMTVPRSNDTFGSGSKITLGAATSVTMNTAANLTTTGTVLNATNVAVTPTHGYVLLNKSATYTLPASTAITFNTGAGIMVNSASAAITFASNAQFTLVNTTTATITGPTTSAMFWTPLSITQNLKGTGTVGLNNGQYDQSKTVTSIYYEDFPVAPLNKVTQQSTTETVFTNAEPNAPGGYTTLDPSIAYYTADSEILNNALLQLDTYNGSATDAFVPLAASYLPSLTNGGINNNYANYTQTTPWGTTYAVNLTPGMNYTFHINSNIKFQNGASMSAWDVMYTFTRTLLFDAASPGTGGWVIAQYLLPGDFFASNSFYNITHNITVNNGTNTITFHFQQSMPASLVFQIFASSGTWIEPAAWFIAHNAGITWTPAGFENYQSQGNLAGYNSYVQNHIMADGPYMISYVIPGSQVTMVKNPNFVQPNNTYYRKPSIDRVNLLYLSSNQQAYLLLKSGQATSAALPTSYWNQTTQMVNQNILQRTGFPTLGLYFYTFTLNTNLSILKTVTSSANLPSNLFLNPNVRKAFAYAYNYSLYYAQQVGNQIYNTTFLSPFAGMLPPGMLYQQTTQDLVNRSVQVINHNGNEPFQLAQAQKYWKIFMSSTGTDGPAAMGIHGTASAPTYNNKPLSVPIMIPNSDPTDKAAVTTWASDLAQMAGINAFPVELPLTDIFAAYAIPGQNPMAISWGGWAPDYPYPTDYLLPMGMPLNSSTYMGPAGFTPYVVGNTSASVYNVSEANFMKNMLTVFGNATSNATNPAAAKMWFQKANGMIVNSTMEVYIGQQFLHWTMSAKISHSDLVNYQQNVMIGGGQDLQYNLLSFTSS